MTADGAPSPLTGDVTRDGVRPVDLAATVAEFDARSWHGPVHGTVPVTSARITVDATGAPTGVSAELDLAGIDTGNTRRDKDLRGPRFFSTGRYPTMTFDSVAVRVTATGWDVDGTLVVGTARCPLTLAVTRGPGPADPFVAITSLDPRQLGLTTPRFLVRKHVGLRITTALA